MAYTAGRDVSGSSLWTKIIGLSERIIAMKNHVLVALAAGCLLLDGCGEFAYKRGAGQDNLKAAQQECQAAGGKPANYEKCMQRRGWFVQELGDLGEIDGSVKPDDPAKLTETDPVATVGTKQDNRDTDSPGQPTAEVLATSKTLLDVFIISSWWKFGGSPAELKASISDCVSQLGEEHAPSSDMHKATRGLLLCMKKRGWHGLQGR